jgi:A/G-specific adenine glycosylase
MKSTYFFTQKLMGWYDPAARPMPWKAIKDPYKIWLSEIILQQTRVVQGLPYYEKFVAAFPTIAELAAADEDTVMKLWEGLGYYSRARNMITAARQVVQDYDGRFPDTYTDILSLKGVGPYTASAIASFAYDLPKAVVDGNVYRILARFFGIDTPIDSTAGKKQFAKLAQDCLDIEQPGRYNQAIMDFGASICTPRQPDCKHCPLREKCQARQQNTVEVLPVKAKKLKKRTRFFYFLDIQAGDHTILQKRVQKDIWQLLYQFPLIESQQPLAKINALRDTSVWQELFPDVCPLITGQSPSFEQTLTHQKIKAVFLKIEAQELPKTLPDTYFCIPFSEMDQYAFPKIIDWYLRDNSLYLNL